MEMDVVEAHAEEDGVVAVQKDVIVDPELGIVAEVEKVVTAVDAGKGEVAVMEENAVSYLNGSSVSVPFLLQNQQKDFCNVSSLGFFRQARHIRRLQELTGK